MIEALPVDLTYGHTGEAKYDEQQQAWTFARTPGVVNRLNIVEGPVNWLGAQGPSTIPFCRNDTFSRYHNSRKLVYVHPGFAPAMRLIQRWAQESEFHEEHAAPRDPLQSELLAFGNVPVIAQQGSSTETVPVAAVAGGIGGDTVTLVRLNQEHLSWREIIPTQMESNIFQGGIESSWSGHDGTIQQLCFAQVIENKQVWLAVRYHANITVLPLLITEKGLLISPGLRLSQGVDRSRRFRSPGTTPLKLLYRRTGGYPHVDVAFNPWEARQFAVVDQEGHWSILAIESRSQREVLWEITGVTSGHVRGGLAEDDDSDGDFDDGWGRIIWLGDADTIAIASRNLLAAFSIEGAPRRLKVPHLGLAQFNDRILDLKRGTPDRGQAFLLTSTRMLLLQSHRRRDQDSQSTNVDISIILSWKHLRDPRDLSLKLSVVQDSKLSGALLSSGMSNVNTFCSFQIPSIPTNATVMIGDICEVPLQVSHCPDFQADQSSQATHDSGPRTVVLGALSFSVGTTDALTGSKYGDGTGKIQRYQLSVLKGDLSVSQSILALESRSFTAPFSHELINRQRGVPGPIMRASIDSFILSHGAADTQKPKQADLYRTVKESEEHGSHTRPIQDDPWTLSMEWLQLDINKLLEKKTVLLQDTLNSLHSVIQQDSDKELLLPKTLFELVAFDFSVKDIDIASDAIVDMLQGLSDTVASDDPDVSESYPWIGTSITPGLGSAVGIGEDLMLLRVHDRLVRCWASSVSPASSSRARVAIERRARSITAQLCLASYQYPFDTARFGVKSVSVQSVDPTDFVLPLRRKSSATALSQKKTERVRGTTPSPVRNLNMGGLGGLVGIGSSPRRALPTPEPTPSLGSPSPFSSTNQAESAASRRLGRLTKIMPQSYSTDTPSRLLENWTEGANPWDYDWDRVRQDIEAGSQTEETSHDQREDRPRKRRKHSRGTVSSQTVPTGVTGSQPAMELDKEMQASSNSTQLMVMSQGEPGLYGSRNIVAKRKNQKRMAGF